MREFTSVVPALPETWAQVLDEVEATLREAETAAALRGQAISHFAPSTAGELERVTLWQQSLERLEARIQGRPTILQQAEKEASNADMVLKAAEEALRRWLSEAEALGQRLAKWVKPGV
jgi:septal ring factor EnvC (AmiA/AmiB activator)